MSTFIVLMFYMALTCILLIWLEVYSLVKEGRSLWR